MSVVEFSRPRRLDTLGAGAVDENVEADADERAALAQRFGLIALDRLAARFTLSRSGEVVTAMAHLSAAATQACIATDDPVPAAIEEDFALLFIPEPGADDAVDELELAAEDCDTVFYTGGAIDLGEAAAETLALALDPFPRSPRAGEAMKAAGVLSEEEAKPAGALAGLADLLGKGGTKAD